MDGLGQGGRATPRIHPEAHIPFCLSILESRVEPPQGEGDCSAAGALDGHGDLGWVGQQIAPRPQATPRSLSGGGGCPSQTSGLSSKHVRVGQFHFDFWLFPFTPFLFSNTLTPMASREKKARQLTKGSESQDHFYLRTSLS